MSGSGVCRRGPMQQGRVGSGRRWRNRPYRFDARSWRDAGWRFGLFGSKGRVDRRNHFRFAQGFERGRRRQARGGETGRTTRGLQRMRMRYREAKRNDERQSQREARELANHSSILHPPRARVQLEDFHSFPPLLSECECSRGTAIRNQSTGARRRHVEEVLCADWLLDYAQTGN